MTRKRIQGTALKTYDDVDQALRQIGELDRQLGLSQLATQEAIDQAKQAHRETAEPLEARKELLERQIKEFAESRRGDFEPVRTRELTFGSIGFRRSSSVVMKRVADTLQALKDFGLTTCIRVKEEPDKEALRDLPADVLASVGASLRVSDAFGYEIARDRIPEMTLNRTPDMATS